MANIDITIRQDNGVSVSLTASPTDGEVATVVDAILSFVQNYPVAVGSRPEPLVE